MAFKISWTIEGEQQLSRKLRGIVTDIKDFTYPLKKISESLVGTFSMDVFETQGKVIGERWERLSPYTLATKARKGYPASPLIATGKMKNSFRTIVTSDYALVYNNSDYFKYHQSNKPRKKLPRRVMMKLYNKQREMIVKEFQVYLQNSVKQNV